MQDITFISDGNPDTFFNENDEPKINFSKRKQIYNAISPVLRFQTRGYQRLEEGESVTPVGLSEIDTLGREQLSIECLSFLRLEKFSDEQLDVLSLSREPREGS